MTNTTRLDRLSSSMPPHFSVVIIFIISIDYHTTLILTYVLFFAISQRGCVRKYIVKSHFIYNKTIKETIQSIFKKSSTDIIINGCGFSSHGGFPYGSSVSIVSIDQNYRLSSTISNSIGERRVLQYCAQYLHYIY